MKGEKNIGPDLNSSKKDLVYQTVIATTFILATAVLLRFVTIVPHECFHYIPAKLLGLDSYIEIYWEGHGLHGITGVVGRKSPAEDLMISIGGGLGVFSIVFPLSLALKDRISSLIMIGMQIEALRQMVYGIDEALRDLILTTEQFYMVDTVSSYVGASLVLVYYFTLSTRLKKEIVENARSKKFGYGRIEDIHSKFKRIIHKDRVMD